MGINSKKAAVFLKINEVSKKEYESVNFLWEISPNILKITLNKSGKSWQDPKLLDDLKQDLRQSAFSELSYISLN